ncbi:hypothetical protein PVAP13_3NG125502 [Panicum virgatum]|uniref:Uncharacterized protein n=1 Tax=Panicum virgatum TaxID=38727 RepID=A0A8T0UCM1_PANVG|nr:hypothetical protein PVAP13_3NG125502 [Panicum virgatum]
MVRARSASARATHAARRPRPARRRRTPHAARPRRRHRALSAPAPLPPPKQQHTVVLVLPGSAAGPACPCFLPPETNRIRHPKSDRAARCTSKPWKDAICSRLPASGRAP